MLIQVKQTHRIWLDSPFNLCTYWDFVLAAALHPNQEDHPVHFCNFARLVSQKNIPSLQFSFPTLTNPADVESESNPDPYPNKLLR
jgi:hypothetical protein